MNNEELNKIIEKSRLKIAISNLENEEKMKKNNKFKIAKILSVVCVCLVLTTGIVFAKDIEKFIKERFDLGLGKGIDNAAENGYIESPEMDPVTSDTNVERDLGEIIDNINTSVKIKDFLMDDYNLSVTFNFEFEEKVKDYINFDNLHNIELSDLFVLDEENRIIYSAAVGEKRFNEFCKEHELNYKYLEFDDNYINNGLNWFPQRVSRELNKAELVYNMYTDNEYPRSKKLDFYFTEITISEDILDENRYVQGEEKTTLKGKWELHVDVPEKMYKRTSEYYEVISTTNEELKVNTAKLLDTCFEIGITVDNLKRPEYPEEVQKEKDKMFDLLVLSEDGITYTEESQKLFSERNHEIYTTSPYKEMIAEYEKENTPIICEGIKFLKDGEEGCYVLNSNGKKFKCNMSPSRKCRHEFVSDTQYEYYETFEMNKYTATDKITMMINYKGNMEKIELEKIRKN